MNTSDLLSEINRLTTELKAKNPTVYKQLKENPLTIPTASQEDISAQLIDYKDTLERLLENA